MPSTRWETRRNALEVLRKICKSMILCTESVNRHVLMKSEDEVAPLADSMLLLARSRRARNFYDKYAMGDVFNVLLKTLGPDASGSDIIHDLNFSSDEEELENSGEDEVADDDFE
ncbi:hypothetical protein PVAG01_09852 [Phlyctema vagabunda]|uniref:Uncharacterized protein n=1 Tax=Phlyctema vagabunda TaxID=108571 RepID=A0ABR4P4F9_9HELO